MRKALTGAAGVFPPHGRYHHGMAVTGSDRLLFLSGQVGICPDGSVPSGITRQTEQLFANIECLLKEGGMDRSHLVKLTAYLLDPGDRATYMAVRDAWVAEPAPASTLLFVHALARPDFMVEVEAIAAA
ncbi:RidA family protein [Geminicoccus harenae]|uniref:RidA family protein n=1 Tax=Geminicoccus harenae TaxID=2498453 RepID=UPI00168AD43B|nr:RidA family protein [Geminicoccus harenae]